MGGGIFKVKQLFVEYQLVITNYDDDLDDNDDDDDDDDDDYVDDGDEH